MREIAGDDVHALAGVGRGCFIFLRLAGGVDEAGDRLCAEPLNQLRHEAAADEAGAAGHEHVHAPLRAAVALRAKTKTRGWSNNRNVSSAASSLILIPNSDGYTLKVRIS